MGNGSCVGTVPIVALDVRTYEISDLYKACEAGDVEQARKLLVDMPFIVINCSEPNGSTALHAASSHGHSDVVHLLLQDYGVVRHRRNSEGLTAYQVAANDEIRQIFHRPKNNEKFGFSIQGTVLSMFAIFFPASKRPPPPWIHTTSGWLKTRCLESQMKLNKTIQNNRLLDSLTKVNDRNLSGLFPIKREAKTIKHMIDMFVKSTHTEYNHACECLTEFEGTEKVEPLLRLYSLETPFYSKVGGPDFCNILLEPLVRNLDALCDRHYQGTSYRGLTMTKEDLEDYEEALRQEKEENKESVIILASFASTTRDELLARGFAAAYTVEDKITVLITCIFPKRCDTAIALYKVSESISCISHFEDEEEVLVYPGTMFRVTEIDTTSDPSITQLHLTNVMPEYHPGAVLCKAAKKKAIKTFVPKILQ